MNRKNQVRCFIISFLLCCIFCGVYTVRHLRNEIVAVIDVTEVEPYLQDGDIICRQGGRFWSAHLRDLSPTDKRFSHLGIVRIQEGSITVIHSEAWRGDGKDCVKEVPLEEFLQSAQTVGLYRANFIDGTVLSNSAIKYKGRLFDWEFDMRDDTDIYCTELLYVILKRIAPEITLKTAYFKGFNKEVVPLEAISKSNDFEEVLYVTGNWQ